MKPWDGTLTPEIRRKLREKRENLGVTSQGVAALLRVNPSSVLKWEQGRVKRVGIIVRRRVEKFMNGDYDHAFGDNGQPLSGAASGVGDGNAGASKNAPPALRAAFDHIAAAYTLFRKSPETQAELLKNVEAATNDVADRFVGGKTKP